MSHIVYRVLVVYRICPIIPIHNKSKQRRQKAWDDGVAPSVKISYKLVIHTILPDWLLHDSVGRLV